MKKFLALVAFWITAWCSVAVAQPSQPTPVEVARPRARVEGARDLVDGPGLAPLLRPPPLPADYVTERRESLSLSYPRAWRERMRPALEHAAADARAVAAQFGLRDLPPLEVRLVPDPEALRALAPEAAPPPSYAVGVAYPAVRLALVSASAPRTWEASEVRQVLRHELSHLLLAEASGHAPLPRWLAEGIAVEQAGEHSFERFQELATASFTGQLLPLRRLDEGFVEGPDRVNVAYAQSADLVAFLLRSEGAPRFALMLAHVRQGASLDDAVRETYGTTLAHLEDEWRRDVDGRFAFAPLWAGTGFLWAVGAVLLVVALIRRRRKSRATLARWEREEDALQRRKIAVVTPGGWRHLRLVPPPAPEAPPHDEPSNRPREASEELPSIALEGERHTLH